MTLNKDMHNKSRKDKKILDYDENNVWKFDFKKNKIYLIRYTEFK